MVARVTVALAAVVVIAWLGVMERDTRLFQAAAKGGPAAEADVRSARFLNPDTGPDLYRAFLYTNRGQWRRSIALIEDVLRREPDNLFAWVGLRAAARGHDPSAVRRADAAVLRLDPVNARRSR
jgi:hypothetical protein